MAETTGISWTKSTFNPWIGCTKVGPGCDHCYAEALDKRVRFGKAVHWGSGVPRLRTSASNWRAPARWNVEQSKLIRAAETYGHPAPAPWLVFCASLADVFDNEVPQAWREDLWKLLMATPHLSWLIVTKRIGNVRSMVPADWIEGFPAHVRLLITVCNQEEADRDVPKLLSLPCKNGISYEPALGPVDWRRYFRPSFYLDGCPMVGDPAWGRRGIDWIIVGGESAQGGAKARPFDVSWAYETVKQCRAVDVPAFVKQLGSSPQWADRAGADPQEWPEVLRVQEFPQ